MAFDGNSLSGKVALIASATLLAVALPSSGFAFGILEKDDAPGSVNEFSFTPAAADPAVAQMIADGTSGRGRMMRFTPAGATSARSERSVTVAVRIDQESARALAASGVTAQSRGAANVSGGLRVTPMRYNLGLTRGYGSFGQSSSQLASRVASNGTGTAASGVSLSRSLSDAAIPDLSTYAPRSTVRKNDSRFAARVEMDENRSATTRGDLGDQLLDLGGSYRLTNNLDITAGVRYEQDREIVPLPDIDQQDSQAVYVGTQFRF